MNAKKVTYSIGEGAPWRLTRDSAIALLKALCQAEGSIDCITADATCPPTPPYCIVRGQVAEEKFAQFVAQVGGAATFAEEAGGARAL